MFDAVRNNRRIVQIFLVLITIPFALWGLESYVRMGDTAGATVATIGKVEISEAELQNAVTQQTESLREQFGAAASEIAESDSFRSGVLDRLINQRVLAERSKEARLSVTEGMIRDAILAIPDFQENGRFTKDKYEAVLRANGMSELMFEDRIRQSVADQMLLAPIVRSARGPQVVVQRWLALQDESREVASVFIDPKPFEAQVKLAAGAVQEYYDDNSASFMVPEQVKLEYLVLTTDTFAKQAKVSDAEALKWYDENKATRYQQTEERRASHILIAVAADANAEAKAIARKKAETLLASLRAKPADFEKEAKAQSADTVSAEQGGDLGFFAADAMVKPFSDAAFKMKVGELSDVVETQYGYHIIKLTEVRGGTVKSFEAVKAEIVDELTRKQASDRYGEATEQLTNLLYEQPDSLKPAAEKLGLTILQSDWIAKGSTIPGPLSNAKLQSAVFSEKVLKERANTEPVDVGDGMLVAARVQEHKPAVQRPFAEVKDEIERALTQTESLNLAQADGQAKLAQLRKGENLKLAWGPAKPIKRGEGLSPSAQKAVFSVDPAKLPAYTGVSLAEGGYTLYRVDKVTKPTVQANDPRLPGTADAYTQIAGEADTRAYLNALRERMDVKVNALPKVSSEEPEAE